MSKISCQIDSDGKSTVVVEDVLRLLDNLKVIAYWSSGEQVLMRIRSDLESLIPAPAPAMVTGNDK